MKYLLILLLILTSVNGFASDQKKRDADQAAGKWLALIDGRQYRDSWEQAASLFKLQVSVDHWMQSITAARKPLGNMISRKLISATYATSLPGAPDGEYVVLQYQTTFNYKKMQLKPSPRCLITTAGAFPVTTFVKSLYRANK